MTWNDDAAGQTVSGDVTLQGTRETPVALRDAEDVYVGTDAVDGTLTLYDPEYVFTDMPVAGDQTVTEADLATAITGDEDGYVKDVAGDVLVTGAEDVFVARDAADSLEVVGGEQVFRDPAVPPLTPEAYDVSLSGWHHSRETQQPTNGVLVRGAKNDVTATGATSDLTVYVIGWENEVHIEGRGVTVDVYFVGRDNTVSVGPYVSATVASEGGYDNTIESAPFPHEELVETTKREAAPLLGRKKVTYQEPAPDEEWCPNCGESADAVVARHHMDALFLFWYPVNTYDDGVAYECEHCSHHAGPSATLSAAERKNLLQ